MGNLITMGLGYGANEGDAGSGRFTVDVSIEDSELQTDVTIIDDKVNVEINDANINVDTDVDSVDVSIDDINIDIELEE